MKSVASVTTAGMLMIIALGWLFVGKSSSSVKHPKFKIINVHDGDRLTGVFYVIAEVYDTTLSNRNINFKVDNFSLGTSDILHQPDGSQTMRFPLPTFHFANGHHTIYVIGNSGYRDSRTVVFSNHPNSIRKSGL